MNTPPSRRLEVPALAFAAMAAAGIFGLIETAGHPAAPRALPTPWDWAYGAAFSVYALPFAWAASLGAGLALRFVLGLALQAAVALPFVAGSAGLFHEPCLLAAAGALAALSLAREGSRRATAAALGLLALGLAAAWMTGRHHAAELLTGLSLGWASYRLASSPAIEALAQGPIRSRLAHELRDLVNVLAGGSRARWEASYAEGHWDFLDSLEQRPRHFAIAGLVADAFPAGASVLDVGCGLGTTYRCLERPGLVYRGVDCSERAVARCRAAFGEGPGRAFEARSFETLDASRRYDVVILNEVLYYFTLEEAERAFRRARSLLASETSLLIVSMNRNWKAKLLWRRLARLERPVLDMRVTNLRTGSYWTVKAFQGAAEAAGAGLKLRAAGLLGNRVYDSALELGCEEGALTELLADRALAVTALDASDAACEAAAERLAERPWVSFETADVLRWTPPPGRSYDLVVAGRALDALGEADLRAFVARLALWLAPGARVLAAGGRPRRLRDLLIGEGLAPVPGADGLLLEAPR